MKYHLKKGVISKIKSLKLIILDVDGILTNGKKLYSDNGKVIGKFYCDLDFTAIKIFKYFKIHVVFLSGDRTCNEMIAKNRNIDFYYSRKNNRSLDKNDFLKKIVSKYKVSIQETCFFGDDIFDINLLLNVGLGVVPNNSAYYLKKIAHIILDGKSGDYLIKEFLDIYLYYKKLNIPQIDELSKIEANEKQKY